MNKSIFPILSFLLIICLGVYLFNFREEIFWPVWIFWLVIIGIFFLITYQVTELEFYGPNHHILIIFQILLTAALIRSLFISPENVLMGYDSYNELINIYRIDSMGYWGIDSLKSPTTNYPIIYIFGMIFSKLLNLNLLLSVKWFPLSIFYLSALIMYLIGSIKYSKKAGLFSMLGFSFIYISVFFHSAFQRETIAVIFMLLTFFIYLKFIYQKENNLKFLILSIFIMSVLVLSHHLTSFIYLILLSIFLLTSFVSQNNNINKYIKKEKISFTLILLLVTMLFGYWTYLKYTPLDVFGLIIKEAAITDPGTGISVPTSIRYIILYYSEIIFSVIFGLLSLISLIMMKSKRRASDAALFIFGGFTGILMVITLFGALIKSEGMGLGSRLQTFVYIGLFLLSGYLFAGSFNDYKLEINRKNLKVWFKKLIPIILIIFLIINIYRIPPNLYSDYKLQPGDARPIISGEELTAANWLGLGKGHVISDPSLNGALKLSEYLNRLGIGHSNDTGNSTIIHSKLVPYVTQDKINENNSEIYDNGNASIFL